MKKMATVVTNFSLKRHIQAEIIKKSVFIILSPWYVIICQRFKMCFAHLPVRREIRTRFFFDMSKIRNTGITGKWNFRHACYVATAAQNLKDFHNSSSWTCSHRLIMDLLESQNINIDFLMISTWLCRFNVIKTFYNMLLNVTLCDCWRATTGRGCPRGVPIRREDAQEGVLLSWPIYGNNETNT